MKNAKYDFHFRHRVQSFSDIRGISQE